MHRLAPLLKALLATLLLSLFLLLSPALALRPATPDVSAERYDGTLFAPLARPGWTFRYHGSGGRDNSLHRVRGELGKPVIDERGGEESYPYPEPERYRK